MRLMGFEIRKISSPNVSLEAHKFTIGVKNNQIKMLELACNKYQDMNEELLKQLKVQNKGTLEERAVDAAIQIFTPKHLQTTPSAPLSKTTPSTSVSSKVLESGVDYPEEQIREQIMILRPEVLKQLSTLNKADFTKQVRTVVPDMSETSILKAKEIVMTLV